MTATAMAQEETYTAEIEELSQEQERTAAELEALSRAIDVSQERLTELEAEVSQLERDETRLRSAMVESADRQRQLASKIEALEERYGELRSQEAGITSSLAERRGVLVEVLAGLQRMGRNPPPALLVSADDALASVRSAIVLGAIVPEMRAETERLAQDLQALVAIRTELDGEREKLIATRLEQAEEEKRLSLLLTQKTALQDQRRAELTLERSEAARLAEDATSLQGLIEGLESKIASVRDAARKAQEVTRLRERQTEAQLERAREMARQGELDKDRFAPALPFETMKGALRLPVRGDISKRFGDDDGTGEALQGIMVTSSSGALVQAPADAWVVYAGPFRSYGQLLILNAGDGYHIVMAGMDRIDVSPGQFVVAGEPVAEMGETRLAGAAALVLASSQPTLYIEFRNDGQPVDPHAWWADADSGRASNDS